MLNIADLVSSLEEFGRSCADTFRRIYQKDTILDVNHLLDQFDRYVCYSSFIRNMLILYLFDSFYGNPHIIK